LTNSCARTVGKKKNIQKNDALILAALDFGETRADSGLDAALVNTAKHQEVTIGTPAVVPRVGDRPVGGFAIGPYAPSENLDSVTTQLLTRQMLINTSFVRQKVLIDREGGFDGSVIVDFRLDHIDFGRHRIGRRPEVAGGGPRGAVATGGPRAGRSGALVLTTDRRAWRQRAVDVMFARRKSVRRTATHRVVATIDHTIIHPELPRRLRVTTATARTTRSAARVDVLSTDVGSLRPVRLDANTIGHGFGGAMSPATAAVALVTDFVQTGAFRTPLCARIEISRQRNFRIAAEVLLRQFGTAGERAHHVRRTTETHANEFVVDAGCPGGCRVGVDLVN